MGFAREAGQEFIRPSKLRNFLPVIGRYRADYTTAKALRALQEKGVLCSRVTGEYLPSLKSSTHPTSCSICGNDSPTGVMC
jgi:hypothetical protein